MPLKVDYELIKLMTSKIFDWDKALTVHADNCKSWISAKKGLVNWALYWDRACMHDWYAMLSCFVVAARHACTCPVIVWLLAHRHVAPFEKIQSQRSRGVCSSKKGGSMHVNTILEINKHINGITKFQIQFPRRNLKLAFLRTAISKTDFPKTDFSKTDFYNLEFQISDFDFEKGVCIPAPHFCFPQHQIRHTKISEKVESCI